MQTFSLYDGFPIQPATDLDIFLEMVAVGAQDECWLWVGRVTRKGYGISPMGIKERAAHRVSWILHKGPIGGFHVLHKCDNPSCVNPNHLFLGTHSDNMRDKCEKGRQPKGPTAPINLYPDRYEKFRKSGGNSRKLSAGDVAEIQALYLTVPTYDLCRKFRVSQSTICNAARGITYGDIAPSTAIC